MKNLVRKGAKQMKKIMLIALGGTISAQGKNRLDLKDYKSGLISPDVFFNDLPEIKQIAQVHFEEHDNISSTAITANHWIDLRLKIIQYLETENYDGVVIT